MRTYRLRKVAGVLVIVAAVLGSIASADTGNDAEVIGGDGSTDTTAVAFDPKGDSGDTEDASDGPSTDPADAQELTAESGMTSGVDSIGTRYTSAGALVTNPNGGLAAYDVEVLFNLIAADGSVLDSDSATVPYIPAFTTVPVAPLQIGFDQAEEAASVEVTITGSFAEDTGWDGVDFLMGDGIDLEVTDPRVAPGSFGTELTAQVTNPSDAVAEFSTWTCVFKSGGAIIGGETSGIMDRIPPGGTVALNAPLSLDLAADEVTCQAYA